MSDEKKAGHAAAVKVGGMRVVQHKEPNAPKPSDEDGPDKLEGIGGLDTDPKVLVGKAKNELVSQMLQQDKGNSTPSKAQHEEVVREQAKMHQTQPKLNAPHIPAQQKIVQQPRKMN